MSVEEEERCTETSASCDVKATSQRGLSETDVEQGVNKGCLLLASGKRITFITTGSACTDTIANARQEKSMPVKEGRIEDVAVSTVPYATPDTTELLSSANC